jgi:hypothetical protein
MTSMIGLDTVQVRLLYEDECLVVIEKPSGMLSVPGREFRMVNMSRSDQWAAVIDKLLENKLNREPDSSYIPILQKLMENPTNVPRQELKFLRYLRRVCRTDDIIGKEVYDAVYDLDRRMFTGIPEELPKSLISATDIVETYIGSKVYQVHRIDEETSGVLVFAKDSTAAAHICGQFMNRTVSIHLLSSFYHD